MLVVHHMYIKHYHIINTQVVFCVNMDVKEAVMIFCAEHSSFWLALVWGLSLGSLIYLEC